LRESRITSSGESKKSDEKMLKAAASNGAYVASDLLRVTSAPVASLGGRDDFATLAISLKMEFVFSTATLMSPYVISSVDITVASSYLGSLSRME